MTEQREEIQYTDDEPNRAQRDLWSDEGVRQYLQQARPLAGHLAPVRRRDVRRSRPPAGRARPRRRLR